MTSVYSFRRSSISGGSFKGYDSSLSVSGMGTGLRISTPYRPGRYGAFGLGSGGVVGYGVGSPKGIDDSFYGRYGAFGLGGSSVVGYGVGYAKGTNDSFYGSFGSVGASDSSYKKQYGGFVVDGVEEKFTMQHLNERMASYVEQIEKLEKANAELVFKMEQFESKTVLTVNDNSAFKATITDVLRVIVEMTQSKESLCVLITNAKEDADEFRTKFESEIALRQSYEAEITGLRRTMDELTLARSNLETQFENLMQDKMSVEMSHDQEMSVTRTSVKGKVNVVMGNAEPQLSLRAVLTDLRAQYEAVDASNQKEVVTSFQAQFDTLREEILRYEESVQLKKEFRSLELEQQTQESIIASLSAYFEDLKLIHSLQDQLTDIYSEMEKKHLEFIRLEQEIQEYRRLLDALVKEGSKVDSSKVVYVREDSVDFSRTITTTQTQTITQHSELVQI